MRTLALMLALAALAAPVSAQQAPVRVPTGIDVPGPTNYRLDGSRVVWISEECNAYALRRLQCERGRGTMPGNGGSDAIEAAANAAGSNPGGNGLSN